MARRIDVEIDDPGAQLREAETAAITLPARDEPAWRPLPTRAVESGDRTAAVERLRAWARDAGATWDGIEFSTIDDQVSVRATRDLRVDEPIFTLPRRLMIIDNQLARSATGQPATPDPFAALAAWLPLEARAPDSRWRPYLDALPARLDALPMFRADVTALAGTAALEHAREVQRDAYDDYAALPAELRARLSLADFAWGYALVLSRAFHAPGTVEHRAALFPLVDLFDHQPGDTTWTYDPLEGYVIRTVRTFATGDAVHITYGARSNAHLLARYGFALPDNPHDEAVLRFARPDDPVNEVAAHLLWELPPAAQLCVGNVLDERLHRALSIARLYASRPADRARAIELGLGPYGDLPWLGDALESAALARLADAARRSLTLLTAPGVIHDGERAVLARLIAFAEHALPPSDPLVRDYLRSIADAS